MRLFHRHGGGGGSSKNRHFQAYCCSPDAKAVHNLAAIWFGLSDIELDYLFFGTKRREYTIYRICVADDINRMPKGTKNAFALSVVVEVCVCVYDLVHQPENSNLTNIRFYLISEMGTRKLPAKASQTVVLCFVCIFTSIIVAFGLWL